MREKSKNHVRNVLVLVLDCVLLLGLVCTFFSYDNSYKEKLYMQNVDEISNINQASANIASTFFSSREAKLRDTALYIEREQLNLSQSMDYIHETNSDPNKSFEIVGSDGKGFRIISMRGGSYAPVDYSSGYGDLCKIFQCDDEALDSQAVHFAPEFTDGYTALKSFAAYNHVRIYDESGEATPYTLMIVSTSADFIDMINLNSGYEKLATTIVNQSGSYIIGSSEFKSTDFFTYLAVFNDLTLDQQNELKAKVSDTEKGSLAYLDGRGRDSVFVYAPVPNKDWLCISSVPTAYFRNSSTEYSFALVVIAVMLTLLVVNLLYLSSLNRKLKVSAERERMASTAKTEFLSSMSHDIRTPMNAIIGMTIIADRQLEEEPVDKAVLRDCIKSIELSGNHLLSLINDILDITKIESGKIVLHESDFSIADTVNQVVGICQTGIRDKNLEFEAHIQGVKHEYTTGDPLRVSQIFTNILTNAVKYTEPRGKVTVTLTEESVADKPELARYIYQVSDTGIGMSPEFVSTIFDRFTRAVDTRINAVQGTGLGMAIVKQLVDLMGGTIDIQSEVNVGSVFTVTLELPIVHDKLSRLKEPQIPILLIDDDPILLETAQLTLQEAGASVDTALGGNQGLAMAALKPYKAIFVDWKMDEMPGLEVISRLREALGNDVRIIVMTAYNITEIERDARAAGANALLTKPLFKSKLVSTVEEVLLGEDKSARKRSEKFPGMRLLVAEDNDTNWKVINKILRGYEIDAKRAVNGKAAVEAVQSNEQAFELILMDIQMPVMNGYEAAKSIRGLGDAKKAATPIYAMTADTFASDIELCHDVGMDGHLAKPIELKKLLAVLRSAYRHEEAE